MYIQYMSAFCNTSCCWFSLPCRKWVSVGLKRKKGKRKVALRGLVIIYYSLTGAHWRLRCLKNRSMEENSPRKVQLVFLSACVTVYLTLLLTGHFKVFSETVTRRSYDFIVVNERLGISRLCVGPWETSLPDIFKSSHLLKYFDFFKYCFCQSDAKFALNTEHCILTCFLGGCMCQGGEGEKMIWCHKRCLPLLLFSLVGSAES